MNEITVAYCNYLDYASLLYYRAYRQTAGSAAYKIKLATFLSGANNASAKLMLLMLTLIMSKHTMPTATTKLLLHH